MKHVRRLQMSFLIIKCFLYGDAKYFDVAEVKLLNNSLAGVNLSGDRFFYVNPLESDGHHLFNLGVQVERHGLIALVVHQISQD